MEYESSRPPVDVEEFRSTMRDAGIEHVVDVTFRMFQDEAPDAFETLETAGRRGNLETVSRAAHSLKSSARSIRAVRLGDFLDALEVASSVGDAAAVDATLAEAREELDAVMAQLPLS